MDCENPRRGDDAPGGGLAVQFPTRGLTVWRCYSPKVRCHQPRRGEAAARAWYTPEWETRMETAFGAKPTVTYYDNHVVVDNETGQVRVDG